MRNHAGALVTCDFCVAVTATFRVLYVSVAMELGTKRLVHVNVTKHPTAAWTLQQFRELLAELHGYRFALLDRESIYWPWLDSAITALGVRVLRTSVQTAVASTCCQKLLGTRRRECLDCLILLGEEHLRRILRIWQGRYNRGRPRHTTS